jgi:hypothetical protein
MAKGKKLKYKFKPIHLFVFAVSLFILTLLLTRKEGLPGKIVPKTDVKQEQVIDEDKRIEISGVKVADFINQTDQGKSPSYYTLVQTPDYHVFYFPADELFFISITSYPFDEHRVVAEQKLIEALAISKDDACKLNVDITTPTYSNPDKAGEVFKLSFCN